MSMAMQKEKLNHAWLRVIQLHVLFFWSALLIILVGIIVGAAGLNYDRMMVVAASLLLIIPGVLFGLGCFIAYYMDAKHIKRTTEERPPRWVFWVVLHFLFGFLVAPVYLALRGRRFDNDWNGLVPSRIRRAI